VERQGRRSEEEEWEGEVIGREGAKTRRRLRPYLFVFLLLSF
jgi:hypothetical protein